MKYSLAMASEGMIALPKADGKGTFRRKRINRSNKLVIDFDPQARKEYITGFHKRKLLRKEEAAKQAEELLKEAKRQARKQVVPPAS